MNRQQMRRELEKKGRLVRVLAAAGLTAPVRPDRALRGYLALRRWGPSPAAGYTAFAARHPDLAALIDDAGTLTFAQVQSRTNALADSLAKEGIRAGDGVAIMCRNHRGFIESTVALSKLGANALYLNTAFAGPQLTDVVEREGPVAVIHDAEFATQLERAASQRKLFVAWPGEGPVSEPTLEELIADGRTDERPAPPRAGRAIVLTSGTTGTPKGAQRSQPQSLDPAVSLLSRIPLQARERTLVSAPLFHTWGFAHFQLGLLLSTTLVLQRRFDPEKAVAAIGEHRPAAFAAVPVMAQRILELPADVLAAVDTSSLRIIALSGSALPGDLATELMDRFGDIVYNLYGSTEVAWATIATPADLRAAPGTAGSPPPGTVLRITDASGHPCPNGAAGRIFVGNEMLFDGYTGGGDKDRVGGLMATGDVGRVDQAGRLFIEGRDDEMIVSGGENVFPSEVEDLLASHDAVAEAAVIGVADDEFGQRLKAFVVLREGAELSAEDAKRYVKATLASYKAPREVEFLAELPRNATGKVLKRDLLALTGGGPPQP